MQAKPWAHRHPATRSTMLPAVLLAACLGLLIGCSDGGTEDPELPLAPDDCWDTEPVVGEYVVQITLDNRFDRIPIAVFEDEIEKNHLVFRDTLDIREAIYELDVDKAYVTTALYVLGADTVLVVDESEIKVIKTAFRDKDCYSTQSGHADLQLRVTP